MGVPQNKFEGRYPPPKKRGGGLFGITWGRVEGTYYPLCPLRTFVLSFNVRSSPFLEFDIKRVHFIDQYVQFKAKVQNVVADRAI